MNLIDNYSEIKDNNIRKLVLEVEIRKLVSLEYFNSQ